MFNVITFNHFLLVEVTLYQTHLLQPVQWKLIALNLLLKTFTQLVHAR